MGFSFNLAARPFKARETFRDALGRRCDLEYRVNGWRHVVVYDRPGNPFPGSRSFKTVQEARDFWREKRQEYGALGYRRKEKKDG